MDGDREVVCRPLQPRTLWGFVGLGVVGAGVAAGRLASGGGFPDGWMLGGLVVAVVGIVCLHPASARVSGDAYGLRSRTVLRRRNVPWRDVADLRIYVQYGHTGEMRRVSVVQRDGHKWRLPLPVGARDARYEAEFDAKFAALRALHRRHGTPQSASAPVIARRTAGRAGPAAPLVVCVLLLIAAGVCAWFVPVVNSTNHAWKAAVPCTARTPVAERAECLSTEPAVIARTTVGRSKQRSWLYFSDGRPLDRLSVSREGAGGFHPGDKVQLTVWRHEVREVTGQHHTWRDHFVGSQTPAVLAALCVLGAGCPGAHALLRRRGRRLPADTVLPSVLPFAGALFGTALWLLPLCYFHPTNPLGTPTSIAWAVAGLLATAAMLTAAWRATRVRTPAEAAGSSREGRPDHVLG